MVRKGLPRLYLNNWLNFRVWGQFEIKILNSTGPKWHKHNIFHTSLKKKKTWTCDHLKTSNLLADNFKKKKLDLDASTPEPAIRPGDTGQRIPCFGSCQLITTLMCNQFSPGLPNKLENVTVDIGMPVVRTSGRAYGHPITKFSRMGRLTIGLRPRARAKRGHGVPLLTFWSNLALNIVSTLCNDHCFTLYFGSHFESGI